MPAPSRTIRPWAPYAAIAYCVFFIASILISSAPKDNASNAAWIAAYASRGEQARHLATGLLLLLAGLCLMTYFAGVWRRIADADPAREPSRVPIAAAGTVAALMGAGGMVMAYISGGELLGKYPLPTVDLLRMSNDLGFALAGVAGSWAAAVAVAVLSVQGHAAGVFSARMRTAGVVAAGVLLLSPLFIPIVALVAWVLVTAIGWLRHERTAVTVHAVPVSS